MQPTRAQLCARLLQMSKEWVWCLPLMLILFLTVSGQNDTENYLIRIVPVNCSGQSGMVHDSELSCRADGCISEETKSDTSDLCTICQPTNEQIESTVNSSCYGTNLLPFDNISDFCAEPLRTLGYNLTVESSNDSNDFNQTEFRALQNGFIGFHMVLQRTVVGNYIRSAKERDECLDAYRLWMCATLLPLYTEVNTSTQEDDCDCTEKRQMRTEGNRELRRVRPCLKVCHRVLQRCPYYVPSKFQEQSSRGGSSCMNDSMRQPAEVIHGGYPAFDCPEEQILEMQWERISNASRDRPLYSLCPCSCLGSGAANGFSMLPLTLNLLCVLYSVLLVQF